MTLSKRDKNFLDEIDELMDEAESNAGSDWATNFVADMKRNRARYGDRFVVSPAQLEKLEQIAGREL